MSRYAPTPPTSSSSSSGSGCEMYASFEETGSTERSTLCGAGRVKASHAVTSKRHQLRVVVYKKREDKYMFMIKLEGELERWRDGRERVSG